MAASTRPRGPGSLVEQARDRAFVGDSADRLGEQRRDGQAADLAVLGIGLAGPDGVGDDQLAELRLGDARRGARPTARRGCNKRTPRSRPAASARRRRCTACPAESTMSSIRMQVRPSTSPMMFITSDSPARSRRLSTIASGALLSRLARPRARTTPPTSGETTSSSRLPKRALDVGRDHRRGEQIVGRDVEEALDLAGVEVDRQHPVGAGGGDQIGDQLGRDRRARPGLPVLPGIAEIGQRRR